jgi:hypothetical protein
MAVSWLSYYRRLLTVKIQVRAQVTTSRICGQQSGTKTIFLPGPVDIISPLYSCVIWGRKKGPVRNPVAETHMV